MPIRVHDPLTKAIDELVKAPGFKWYSLFELLEHYYTPDSLMKLLHIGRTSYYNYKKTKESKNVERKLFDYYNTL
jgi:hypothetical protein